MGAAPGRPGPQMWAPGSRDRVAGFASLHARLLPPPGLSASPLPLLGVLNEVRSHSFLPATGPGELPFISRLFDADREASLTPGFSSSRALLRAWTQRCLHRGCRWRGNSKAPGPEARAPVGAHPSGCRPRQVYNPGGADPNGCTSQRVHIPAGTDPGGADPGGCRCWQMHAHKPAFGP